MEKVYELSVISVVTGEQIYINRYKYAPTIRNRENGQIIIQGDTSDNHIEFTANTCLFHIRKQAGK